MEAREVAFGCLVVGVAMPRQAFSLLSFWAGPQAAARPFPRRAGTAADNFARWVFGSSQSDVFRGFALHSAVSLSAFKNY
ncbi:hypothetical protein AMK16_27465 [Streptomyces sp. CB00455]|nr:hypothetical protein AMK16_27465 [Streptomyces sp. CB00455]